MSDEKFKGASFNADFVVSRESIDKMLLKQTKVEVFRKVVKNALKRVEYDLTDEMKLKDPETYVSDITKEMIDNFLKHGLKIVITGEVITEEERKERDRIDPFGFGEKK